MIKSMLKVATLLGLGAALGIIGYADYINTREKIAQSIECGEQMKQLVTANEDLSLVFDSQRMGKTNAEFENAFNGAIEVATRTAAIANRAEHCPAFAKRQDLPLATTYTKIARALIQALALAPSHPERGALYYQAADAYVKSLTVYVQLIAKEDAGDPNTLL